MTFKIEQSVWQPPFRIEIVLPSGAVQPAANPATAVTVAVIGPSAPASEVSDGDKGEIIVSGGEWLVDNLDCGTFN